MRVALAVRPRPCQLVPSARSTREAQVTAHQQNGAGEISERRRVSEPSAGTLVNASRQSRLPQAAPHTARKHRRIRRAACRAL